MRSQTLEPGEGITEFAAELRKLARAAYPDFDEATRDRLTLEKFITCVPTQMRFDLMDREPEDLHEAVNCTKKFSMRQKIIQKSETDNKLVQVQNELEQLRKQLNQTQLQQSQRNERPAYTNRPFPRNQPRWHDSRTPQ